MGRRNEFGQRGGCCGDKPQELCLKNPLIPETAIKAEEGRQYGFPSQKNAKKENGFIMSGLLLRALENGAHKVYNK